VGVDRRHAPATSLQADGPQNLLDAVHVACHPGAHGVLAVLAGAVQGAAVDVRKSTPTASMPSARAMPGRWPMSSRALARAAAGREVMQWACAFGHGPFGHASTSC